MLPTQCNPFDYGTYLASPGFCPWCLGDEMLPPDLRMRQFLDRSIWQDHVEQHISELSDCKPNVCPHPRAQCTEAFDSILKLTFHLQDVHRWIQKPSSRKNAKRCLTDTEVKPKARHGSEKPKVKRQKGSPDAKGYRFLDEAARFPSSPVTPKSSASSPDIASDQDICTFETKLCPSGNVPATLNLMLLDQLPWHQAEPMPVFPLHYSGAALGSDMLDDLGGFGDMSFFPGQDHYASHVAASEMPPLSNLLPPFDWHAAYGDGPLIGLMAA